MFKNPIDFEYNKYTLLDYLQKCEKNFENLEIYPDFIELSLHLANIQSLNKENMLLLTNKKFSSIDDEILLKELRAKKPPLLTTEEKSEIDMTIKYSMMKMYDIFNLGKSIWNLAFDNIVVSVKRNKKNKSLNYGYSCFYEKKTDTLTLWEYELSNESSFKFDTKKFNIIFSGKTDSKKITTIIEENTNFKSLGYKKFPIFEVKSEQMFPVDETLVPIMKRKIIAQLVFSQQKQTHIN